MKLNEIENKKIELTPSLLSEHFDAVEGMHIYGHYILNKNLTESNSEEEVNRINILHTEDPTVSQDYYGLSFVVVNDTIHPYDNFYGKVINKKRLPNGGYRCTVEFSDGSTTTYPNEVSSLMPYKTLFHSDKLAHNDIELSLKLSDTVDFSPIRK